MCGRRGGGGGFHYISERRGADMHLRNDCLVQQLSSVQRAVLPSHAVNRPPCSQAVLIMQQGAEGGASKSSEVTGTWPP